VNFEEKMFRAEVLTKCGEKYSVFLIDIGKNIDVLGYNIYELPNSLKNVCNKFTLELICYFCINLCIH